MNDAVMDKLAPVGEVVADEADEEAERMYDLIVASLADSMAKQQAAEERDSAAVSSAFARAAATRNIAVFAVEMVLLVAGSLFLPALWNVSLDATPFLAAFAGGGAVDAASVAAPTAVLRAVMLVPLIVFLALDISDRICRVAGISGRVSARSPGPCSRPATGSAGSRRHSSQPQSRRRLASRC